MYGKEKDDEVEVMQEKDPRSRGKGKEGGNEGDKEVDNQ